jgi:AraC-like DNA-binding protein
MLEFIAKNYDTPIKAADIASHVSLHPNYAMGQFKKVMRTSIKQYVNSMRINHARALLSDTNRSILDIALTVGFSANSRFYDSFQKVVGTTPQAYRDEIRQARCTD